MDLSQESFERLLAWLHPDREEAGRRYVKIRSDLTKKFTSHHCSQPEMLADFTVDRVAQKLPEIIDTFVGEPERYFHRVAFFVLMESRSKKLHEVEFDENLPVAGDPADDKLEVKDACLERCFKTVPNKDEELIRRYYYGDKGAKIRQRKELASKFNVKLPVLRVMALRIRQKLERCIVDCLQELSR